MSQNMGDIDIPLFLITLILQYDPNDDKDIQNQQNRHGQNLKTRNSGHIQHKQCRSFRNQYNCDLNLKIFQTIHL